MHITEGIITGSAAVLYSLAGVGLVSLGVCKMKRFVAESTKKAAPGLAGRWRTMHQSNL